MKLALRIIIALVFGFIIFGIYTNSASEGEGEKFIGIGVLIFAFVLMPLFIYHRYNGRDLSQYSFKNLFQPGNKIEDVIKRNEQKKD
ncbi:MAG: hypothetical protein J7K34_03395 [Flavobacteriaceae bacterium]|nr:hypothetical protein [Flavobacteriaceae bacterium]